MDEQVTICAVGSGMPEALEQFTSYHKMTPSNIRNLTLCTVMNGSVWVVGKCLDHMRGALDRCPSLVITITGRHLDEGRSCCSCTTSGT